jgi:aryl-alcohol dehydrogenase-like predicted oxidoreductase
MTFGAETGEPEAHRLLDRFLEAGGTLVDTADTYGEGRSEEIIGRWFASRPAEVTGRVVLPPRGGSRSMTRRTGPGCPRAI